LQEKKQSYVKVDVGEYNTLAYSITELTCLKCLKQDEEESMHERDYFAEIVHGRIRNLIRDATTVKIGNRNRVIPHRTTIGQEHRENTTDKDWDMIDGADFDHEWVQPQQNPTACGGGFELVDECEDTQDRGLEG